MVLSGDSFLIMSCGFHKISWISGRSYKRPCLDFSNFCLLNFQILLLFEDLFGGFVFLFLCRDGMMMTSNLVSFYIFHGSKKSRTEFELLSWGWLEAVWWKLWDHNEKAWNFDQTLVWNHISETLVVFQFIFQIQ